MSPSHFAQQHSAYLSATSPACAETNAAEANSANQFSSLGAILDSWDLHIYILDIPRFLVL